MNTDENLQNAIVLSQSNQDDDIIRIVDGTIYDSISLGHEVGFSLKIEYGYNSDCTVNLILPVWDAITDDSISGALSSNWGKVEPQKTTTGPFPSFANQQQRDDTHFDWNSMIKMNVLAVPAYSWHHGCGPTAAGMLLGYWDMNGLPDLFDGEATIQTDAINQGIASVVAGVDSGHVEDYARPWDDYTYDVLPDKSEGTEPVHVNNSIADFMYTSRSARQLSYGESWSSMITPALAEYSQFKNPLYKTEIIKYYTRQGTLSWDVLTAEIDNNRPMIFQVDSDGDGYSDHIVTVVGYRETAEGRQYACHDTWYDTLRWCNFMPTAPGQPWGVWCGWSYRPETIIGNALKEADLISPSGNIDGNHTPDYTWQEVKDSTWYYLWVDGPGGNVIKKWYQASEVCSASICSVQSSFLNDGSYQWWIKSWNPSGSGPWSIDFLFTVGEIPPPAATLISPDNESDYKRPTYTWNAVSSATWYYLWVDDIDNSANEVKQWYRSSEVCSGKTCSASPHTGTGSVPSLKQNTDHTWWIRTWNSAGSGAWSSPLQFHTSIGIDVPPPPPDLIAPSDLIDDNAPNYLWNEVSNATWYFLWVNDSSGNRIQQWYESTDICSGKVCSVIPSIQLKEGTCTWWVQGWNAAGYGKWSSGRTFYSPSNGELDSLNNLGM